MDLRSANIARKTAAVRRALGEQPVSVRLVPLDFEHDDVLDVLTGHGYRPDSRTFFVWEAVTQYLSAEAVDSTLRRLRQATSGSRLVFTYVLRDFIDGINRPTPCTAGSGSVSGCGSSGCRRKRWRRFWPDTDGNSPSKPDPT